MTTELTNEEKINVINQHIRTLEFLAYNIYLDLIQANTLSSPEKAIAEIQARQSEVEAKLLVLQSEKASLS
jgi:hypothetical protein